MNKAVFLMAAIGLFACGASRDAGNGSGDAAVVADGGPDAAAPDAATFDAGVDCVHEVHCLSRPWPLACAGDWTCSDGACTAVCREAECAAAADCDSKPKKKACTGHWECLSGGCLEVCDSVACADAADCVVLPWPLECEGHWECGDGSACSAGCDDMSCDEDFPFRAPRTDASGKLLPWAPYDVVLRSAMEFIRACPADRTTGLPWYMQYPSFRYQNMSPSPWPHNPAGLYGMMVETLLRWWPYTGDREWIEITRRALDYLIDQSTPDSYLWPRVPFASADNSGTYRGGSSEGFDGIEPDKVAQAAVGYLRFYMTTGEEKYRAEAEHCADVLAANVRDGDKDRSPWAFRLNARTGEVLEEYTSDMVWPIALFDDLKRLGLSTPGRDAAREAAWRWLSAFPMRSMEWKGYFEDVIIDEMRINREQYTAGETARYLMRRPGTDPKWKEHVPAITAWIKEMFGDDSAKWLGGTGIREQTLWQQLSGSHTARYASLLALWHDLTNDAEAREEAVRSFALASYMARDDGVVIFSICDTSVWFSDGYFDYVPHFIDGMAALPEMAPGGEDHLLGTTSVITDISYSPGRIEYRTFDADGTEVLRLSFSPASVSADYSFDPSLNVLKVSRKGAKDVVITAK
ncbi:MAG: hypothetical protein HY897_03625 [Deltaproteobacteria bacterium]|nr:hypothetical protein [Deltaproteobacteria bacterium]